MGPGIAIEIAPTLTTPSENTIMGMIMDTALAAIPGRDRIAVPESRFWGQKRLWSRFCDSVRLCTILATIIVFRIVLIIASRIAWNRAL